MKMEQIECSETLAYIIQMPGNYPKENIMYELILIWYALYNMSSFHTTSHIVLLSSVV